MRKHFLTIPALATAAGALALIAISPFSASGPEAQASHSHEITTVRAEAAVSSLVAATGEQLMEVMNKTGQYRNIHTALGRGYANIDVFMPFMGCHYLNAELLDGTFDHERPEILVYAEEPGQKPILIAVEYAVPISESPAGPPQGFAGSYDVWDHNETFGLWTLHAWTELPNPDGVFGPFNPLAPEEFAGCGTAGHGDD